MGEVTLETKAYTKLMLHAAKYPHCAVNGVLLAEGIKAKDGTRTQDLEVVDAVPLFHHSHYVSPMAEVALTQIEAMAQSENRVIVGYYAAGENFKDNTREKCPGLKIAEKIAEYYPSAVFIVIDNQKMTQQLEAPALKVYRYQNSQWKEKSTDNILFQTQYVLETVSYLLQMGIQKDLVDFDNYLDDISLDWTNLGVEKLVAGLNASNSIDFMDKSNNY